MGVLRTLVLLVPLSLAVASCGGSDLVPPGIGLIDGRLVGAGLLDQQLQLVLCVSNPNRRAINLDRVTFALAMAGDTVATGVSEAALDLASGGSVPVPFAVSTSLRGAGAPLAALLSTGALDYSVSGTVLLRDFTLLGIPYRITGRIDPFALAARMVRLQPSRPTACDAPPPGTALPAASAAPGPS